LGLVTITSITHTHTRASERTATKREGGVLPALDLDLFREDTLELERAAPRPPPGDDWCPGMALAPNIWW